MTQAVEDGQVKLGDGTTLHVVTAGAGKPLVMIPGWSQSVAEFKHQIPALANGRRVIAIDMRGHGLSDEAPGGLRISRLSADLHEVLNTLDLHDVDLLGHSMGCSIIWSYLDLFGTDRLARLILVDQGAACVGRPGWSGWSETERDQYGAFLPDPAALGALQQAVLAAEDAEGTADVLKGMFTPGFPRDELLWVAKENLKMSRGAAAQLLYEHALIDWRDVVRTIDLPSLVIGGHASFFSEASQAWIAGHNPNAELAMLGADEGGSHFMFLENPEKFNALVEAFLTRA